MRKQNALIAGMVVIASVLALAQSANAQQYYRPYPGRPMGPPAVRPTYYNYYPQPARPPAVLPYVPQPTYHPPQPYYPQPPRPVPQQPYQGAQWNTTSNGWPQFPTLGQDVQGAQQFYNNVVGPACLLFGC
jgi:hypothetical protein